MTTERDRQYRAIFEATSDGLIINARDGTVLDINPAFCRMHGYTRDELVGQHLALFIHPNSHAVLAEYLAAVRRGESFLAQVVDVRKDGTAVPVEVHGSAFTYAGEPAVLGVVRNISERAHAYEQLELRVAERTRELTSLLAVARDVSSTLQLTPLLSLILDRLKLIVAYDGAGILALEGDEFTVMGYRGPLPQEQALKLRFRLSEELGHWHVVQSKEPLLVADTWTQREQLRAARGDDAGMKTHFDYIRSWMLVPLIYKDRVIGALSVEHSQPNFYAERDLLLANAIASQVAIAMENARLYEQAQRGAALEERARLARDLHDSVSQAVYGMTLYTETASRLLAQGDTQAVASYLAELRGTAREALHEMRLLIFELRPPKLEELGLAGALRARLEAVEGRARGLEARVEVGEYERLALDTEEALYRIAQEALNNAMKHAAASQITVTLRQDAPRTLLQVADDGAGFDPAAVPPGRLGLSGMYERAARLGATLTVESAPGHGTHIWVEVPR
jgi:PAS domain S-box-containing protein